MSRRPPPARSRSSRRADGGKAAVGAAFANMEMDIVLRTVLRQFTVQTTDAPGEKRHSRGVAFTPARGGRVVVYRRR